MDTDGHGWTRIQNGLQGYLERNGRWDKQTEAKVAKREIPAPNRQAGQSSVSVFIRVYLWLNSCFLHCFWMKE